MKIPLNNIKKVKEVFFQHLRREKIRIHNVDIADQWITDQVIYKRNIEKRKTVTTETIKNWAYVYDSRRNVKGLNYE